MTRQEAEKQLRMWLSNPDLHSLCMDAEPDREVLVTHLAGQLMRLVDNVHGLAYEKATTTVTTWGSGTDAMTAHDCQVDSLRRRLVEAVVDGHWGTALTILSMLPKPEYDWVYPHDRQSFACSGTIDV